MTVTDNKLLSMNHVESYDIDIVPHSGFTKEEQLAFNEAVCPSSEETLTWKDKVLKGTKYEGAEYKVRGYKTFPNRPAIYIEQEAEANAAARVLAERELVATLERVKELAADAFAKANVFSSSEREIIRLAGDIMQDADAALANWNALMNEIKG